MKSSIAKTLTPEGKPGPSLHLRILTDVREHILSGTWQPGHRLQTETDMARDYGCSRMTVNKALVQLTRAGLLQRTRRSGTFVKAPRSLSAAIEITDIRQQVEESGREYGYRLITDSIRDTTPVDVAFLDADEIAQVREIACLHVAGGTPFCFEERLINTAAVPGIAEVSFAESGPGRWLMQRVPWMTARHQIFATGATADVARMLRIAEGSPCLVVERRTRNDKGRVTSARLSYPGDQHRLFATFTPTDAG